MLQEMVCANDLQKLLMKGEKKEKKKKTVPHCTVFLRSILLYLVSDLLQQNQFNAFETAG